MGEAISGFSKLKRRIAALLLKAVIAGLDPAIHPPSQEVFANGMDTRVKPAHDEAGSRDRRADASLAPATLDPSRGCRMTRIAIIDRADINAQQTPVYKGRHQPTRLLGGSV